jgi:hypothetical protein
VAVPVPVVVPEELDVPPELLLELEVLAVDLLEPPDELELVPPELLLELEVLAVDVLEPPDELELVPPELLLELVLAVVELTSMVAEEGLPEPAEPSTPVREIANFLPCAELLTGTAIARALVSPSCQLRLPEVAA